jgi:tRNA(Arg) A34 adenosine deaminase TadA
MALDLEPRGTPSTEFQLNGWIPKCENMKTPPFASGFGIPSGADGLLMPGVDAPGAAISPNASPSGADGLLMLPVDQGGDATVNPISPEASGEMGSDGGDEGSPGGEGGDPVGEGGDDQPGSLREEGSPSAPGSPGAEARLKRILAAASNVVKKKTKKQAEVRWSNDATWTLFIQCVKAVKPAGADGWNTVAHEFRTACETWNKRQPSPYSRHIITCGALSCVGSQLRSKWNTYLKRQKPTGVGPCRDQKTERTRQVHELQQTIEEEIAAGDIGVRQEKPTFDKQPKSRQAAEAEVASSAEKRKREHDAMTLIEKETFSSDDLDHASRVLIAEAGKSAAKLKKSQACQLSDRMDASENARREFVLMQMNHSKEMMAEFARQQHIMIQTLLTGLGAVPAQPLNQQSAIMDAHMLADRILTVIGEDVVPLTKAGVAKGDKVFGAAILRKSDFSLVVAGTNEETVNPLHHGEVSALNAWYKLPKEARPSPTDCIFVATHEPCSLCLSAITWAGFDNFTYFFRYGPGLSCSSLLPGSRHSH